MSNGKVTYLCKRNGDNAPFELKKLISTISKAAEFADVKSKKIPREAALKAKAVLDKKFGSRKIPRVKDVKDAVNSALIKMGQQKMAGLYMKYRHPDCKFCEMNKDKENILYENKHITVVFGRPHHKGHLVILTKMHEENIMFLNDRTINSFMNDTIKVCKALYKAIKFDRLNIEYLNNWDPHIHWNVYPRFRKDKDWGQPPHIPKKKEKFKEQYLDWKEVQVFRSEIKKRLK